MAVEPLTHPASRTTEPTAQSAVAPARFVGTYAASADEILETLAASATGRRVAGTTRVR
jgi:hypothetical protein